MKTAQLPQVLVESSVRKEIEDALYDGESLSEFVEAAALQAARRRMAQEQFLAHGRPAEEVLNRMRARLDERMDEDYSKEQPPAAQT